MSCLYTRISRQHPSFTLFLTHNTCFVTLILMMIDAILSSPYLQAESTHRSNQVSHVISARFSSRHGLGPVGIDGGKKGGKEGNW
jgi:hypothetical protein